MLLPNTMSGTVYAGDRVPNSTETEFSSNDIASTGIFSTEYRKHEDLKNMLDGNKDVLKLEAMKRIIGMIAKGKDASDLFPAVVKNVVSKNIEVKKLVYVYLVRYAEEQQDLALLSISTFQRALKDPNQLIRASALRVLSSIRVPVIVPIMMLAIRDAVNDMSPYVRKTAAHAIPKLYSLDPEQKDQLIEVLEKLLSDKTTLVMGSAVMAFEEVCPERIDLIHKNYRKLCNLLVDVEEWGQVVIMNMLIRYARTQFTDPNKYDDGKEGEEKPFYESDNSHSKDDDEIKDKKAYVMDPDHRLLLRNCKPLLQSRNSAVVMGVVQLYYYLAPRTEVNIVAKALIRLTHSHREIQSVVLSTIATLTTRYKGMFEPYLKSFFVRSSDPTHIKLLKLEILTNLATEGNVSFILREFQTYVSSPDMDFVAAAVQAIGRCASSISEVTDTCLNGLVSLLSNRNETVVAESVVVIKKLLQMQITEHKDIIIHMSRLMDTITVPMARASILWLIGEYADKVTKIAPDVLRKVAKTFSNEEDIVKLQALNLAAKLYLTNSKQTKLLVQYVFNLAKYDINYDIRDRARFLRQLIMPQGEKISYLAKHAKKILLASKPAPVLQSRFKDRDRYQLGSLSHYINARTIGYHDLPPFPEAAPDPSVRNVETQVPWQEFNFVKKSKKKTVKKKSFYSETESSSAEGAASVSSASEAGKSEASNESSASESESETSSNSKSESGESGSEASESETELKTTNEDLLVPIKNTIDSDVKPKVFPNSVPKPKKDAIPQKAKKVEKKESSSETESDSESDSDQSVSSESEEEIKVSIKKKKATKEKKEVDLLLDLDDFSTTSLPNPVIQPAVFSDMLTPTTDISLKLSEVQMLAANNCLQTVSAAFTPTKQYELLNKYNGKGVCITYRFTRSPNLYSAKMTTVELSINNSSDKEICGIHIPTKKVGSIEIHGFPEIQMLAPNSSIRVTFGIDYNESTQPAKFELETAENSYTLSIKAPVGEMIQPVLLSEGEFNSSQSKLKGMNENSGTIDLSSGHADEKAVIQYVYEAANVMQVQNNDKESKILRFSGVTPSTKCLVLISIQVLNNGKAILTVNCEKMIIGSMFFKELKEALSK
ncbi:AP-3 complex subunit beta-1-like isoform X1 [Stegodyphus dumicola]|uniref:AP-3 complex subunit beta-1-like isoform X1 n=2 Tax=Stegodyphus dumicola TaxID=202533 RepID=UPI0015AF526D|nr:AP-3 complex subunit beta-1-like isoform X1 [Stegodyphus dumicola]XP_035221752.1 AP-3 complex subunit beta-1-like isoform X1 [Stegodyphus dumicola]